MVEENRCVRLTRKVRATTLACTNHIWRVPKRREKKFGVYRAQWHQGEVCSGAYELGLAAKYKIDNTRIDLSFQSKYWRNPSARRKPKDEEEGTIVAVAKSGHCYWVPKSNHIK